ncbi:MAG TPA: DUF3109 family protein [bacterium]|nr:DUF3109 family protein [bacterium]
MLLIRNVFIPRQLLTLGFACPYHDCGGMCCVNGDSGAPAEPEEIERIEREIEAIRPALDPASREWIDANGVVETRGNRVSIQCLAGHGRCVFFTEGPDGKGCILETRSRAMGIPTLRPLSCRLFPLRIRHYNGLTVLDYEVWQECKKAWQSTVPLVETCRQALTDAFGQSWIDTLDQVRRRLSGPKGHQ